MLFPGAKEGELGRVGGDWLSGRLGLLRHLAEEGPRFERSEDLLGPRHHFLGHPRQSGHLDAIALVGAPFHDLTQEEDLLVPFPDRDVEVFHVGKGRG